MPNGVSASSFGRVCLGFVLLVFTMGHDHGCSSIDGQPSGAGCPPDSTLTYENFGQPFMESYCIHCHASWLQGGGQRRGAPVDHDFDTQLGVQVEIDHIDRAAAGSDAMPPYGPRPTADERTELAEWLACGAP